MDPQAQSLQALELQLCQLLSQYQPLLHRLCLQEASELHHLWRQQCQPQAPSEQLPWELHPWLEEVEY